MKKISIMCLAIICFLASLAYSQNHKGELKSNPYPLRYVITDNRIDPKIVPDDEERRFIEVLIKPRYFTKANLTALFQIISKRFSTPETLYITVYTDKKDILTPKERAEGYLISVDAQGKETQIRPSLKGRSNQKDTATFIRHEGRMKIIMDGQSEEIEMNTSQNKN